MRTDSRLDPVGERRRARGPRLGTWVAVVAAGCAGLGCSGGDTVVLPRVPDVDGALTEILAVGEDTDDAPETHYVIDLRADTPLRFDLPDGSRRFEAFMLTASIEQLGISTGRDTLREGAPPPDDLFDSFSADYQPGEPIAWAAELAPRWTSILRFPGLDPVACVLGGGCFAGGRCQNPCNVTVPPVEVAAAVPPAFDCPTNWAPTRIEVAGRRPSAPGRSVEVCDPWPAPLSECEDDEIGTPGAGCRALGPPCPVDDFGPPGPAAAVYVDVDAPAGGDGSRQRPLTSLADGIAVAPAGRRILLAAGTYPIGLLTVAKSIDIVGTCPGEVILDGDIRVTAGPVGLDAVTVSGTVEASVSADLVVAGAHLRAPTGPALRVVGGRVQLDGTRLRTADAPAVLATVGATVVGSDIDVGAAMPPAVELTEGANATIENWAVFAPQAAPGTAINVERSSLDARQGFAIGGRVRAVTSTVALTQVVLREGPAEEALVAVGGNLVLEQVWFDRPNQGAIQVVRGTAATLADVVVHSTAVDPLSLVTGNASEYDWRRTAIVAVGGAAALLDDTRLTIEDFILHGTDLGVTIMGGNVGCRGDRLEMSSVGERTMYLDEESVCSFDQVRVSDVGFDNCSISAGLGSLRSTLTLTNARFDDIQGVGISIEEGAARIEDVWITDVAQPEACNSPTGNGIEIDAAAATLRRFRIERATRAGLLIISSQGGSPEVDAQTGVVSQCVVGVEITAADVDIGPLIESVDYSDTEFPLVDNSSR